jgi:hypothetical protein
VQASPCENGVPALSLAAPGCGPLPGLGTLAPVGRSCARALARKTSRRKRARPAPPQTPNDFFSQQAQKLLSDLWATRAVRWQGEGAPPLYFYGRDSEPMWDADAQHRCSGTTLRIARKGTLYECLCIDLERGLRLLTLDWTQGDKPVDGYEVEEWRRALAGVCWRVGQVYRELVRRKGEDEAQEVLRRAMETLWW